MLIRMKNRCTVCWTHASACEKRPQRDVYSEKELKSCGWLAAPSCSATFIDTRTPNSRQRREWSLSVYFWRPWDVLYRRASRISLREWAIGSQWTSFAGVVVASYWNTGSCRFRPMHPSLHLLQAWRSASGPVDLFERRFASGPRCRIIPGPRFRPLYPLNCSRAWRSI